MNILMLTDATIIGLNRTGIPLGADVAMHSNIITGLHALTASGTIANNITTTNTLRTSGVAITIMIDLVLFRGLDSSIYMDAHPGGMLFNDEVYMDAFLKVQNGISI